MLIKAESTQVTLSREAKLQMKDLLRDDTGQQATRLMTLHLPSERGCVAHTSTSRKVRRDHPLIISFHFPGDTLSISAACANFLEPCGQGEGRDSKNSHETLACVSLKVMLESESPQVSRVLFFSNM